MAKLFATLVAVTAVLSVGCGDSRLPYVATFNGVDATLITPAGGGTPTNFSNNLNGFEISDSVTPGKILVPIGPGGCVFLATVSSATAFSIDPGSTCTFTSSGGTVFSWTTTSGTGTLNTNSLTYTVSSNITQNQGGIVLTGTESDSVSATKE